MCPITQFLALAFADNAFEAESIKSPDQIFGLDIEEPIECIQLKWKRSRLQTPIFRQAVKTVDGWSTSSSKALNYSTFQYYIGRLGCATGFEEDLSLYCVRRGTGNAVDGM